MTHPRPSRFSGARKALWLGLAALSVAASCDVRSSASHTAVAATAAPPTTFLALSDVHYGVDADSHQYCGFYTETDDTLWTAAQTQAKALVNSGDPGFLIYLGDLPAHCEDKVKRETEFTTVLDGLAKLVVNTTTPLLYLPGNNDSVGPDYCTFTVDDNGKDKTPLDFSSAFADSPVVNGELNIISRDAVHGYYSVYPLGAPPAGSGRPGLRVIAMNTVMFTDSFLSRNGGCVDSATRQSMVSAQLDWVYGQLVDAASKKEKVILAMHVPPGVDGYTVAGPHEKHSDYAYMWGKSLSYSGTKIKGATAGDWVQKVFLEDLVAAHSPNIVGVLSSHTHLNGIRRLRDCSDTLVELNLSIPAITEDHGSNAAMKLISYDAGFEWTQADTYYATSGNNGYDWSAKPFRFTTSYPCPSGISCNTLFDNVKAIGAQPGGDQTLLGMMLQVLKVKPGHTARPRSYGEALDTRCVPYPKPQ